MGKHSSHKPEDWVGSPPSLQKVCTVRCARGLRAGEGGREDPRGLPDTQARQMGGLYIQGKTLSQRVVWVAPEEDT